MKNTKKVINLGIAIAITSFITTNISASQPDLGTLTSMVTRHEVEIQQLKLEIEVLKQSIEKLVTEKNVPNKNNKEFQKISIPKTGQ
jgi:hypothetical protein